MHRTVFAHTTLERESRMHALSPRAQMATLLVADDHPDVLELLLTIFESEGYRVFTAQDGLEAVAAVEQYSPDAVLMDIWMPNLDGVAATERIRALPGHAQLPVIAFTAHPKSLGGHAHLFNGMCVKPCAPAELMKVIAGVLRNAV